MQALYVGGDVLWRRIPRLIRLIRPPGPVIMLCTYSKPAPWRSLQHLHFRWLVPSLRSQTWLVHHAGKESSLQST